MEVIYLILFFVLGLCLGSFYHVVGYRLPRDENIIKPKQSYCPECHHPLGILDLIPVFSYVFHKGRCHYCHKKISISYPIIELITGLLFALSFHLFGFSVDFGIALVLSSMLSIILVSDIQYLIIPDSVTVIGFLCLLILRLVSSGIWDTLLGICSGVFMFCFMYLLMLLGNLLFRKESLGGADIKLMFVAGFLFGPFLSLCLIFISSLLALPVAIGLYIGNKENKVPYGPFLMIGMLILHFSQIDVSTILTLLKFY